MDRNREGRRGSNSMAAPPNGLSSSRRRHRSSSLRDSPDEDGTVEVPEPGRLRDRGVVKKDRDRDRDRERERERERSSRSKRRRENRMMMSNRDDGDDTSEESVNDEDEEDDDDAGNGGRLRMLPPSSANPSTSASTLTTHNSHPQQLHHRKSFPPVNNKVFRAAAAAPPPAWKAADEMIGVSVPRKARSASTKRSHEWISGVASSTSPVRLASSAASPAQAAPPSPSSSNVSARKKMKSNGGGSNSKPRPPKSSSKSSSSNPEELEIEIAEVLYGLMTQSQAPSKKEITSNDSSMKFDSNKSSSEAKSRVSSPVSNSTTVPQNSTSLSAAALKRKRPRQVSETSVNARNSPVEFDHNQHHQSPKTDNCSASAAAEIGGSSFGFTTLPGQKASSSPSSEQPTAVEEERKCGANVLTKEEVEKESAVVKLNDGNSKVESVIKTAASTTVTNLKVSNLDTQSQKDEKFEIDLMAPPPQSRPSHGNDQDVDLSDHKQIAKQETIKTKDDDKLRKSDKDESIKLTVDQKSRSIQETGESKQVAKEETKIQLNLDLEKTNKGSGSGNRSLHQALKHQQLTAKSESHSDKTAQSTSMPMPMSMGNWPPMGYVAPLQGVISMDGNPMASAPIQPLLTHPRPKRCATHCYIARNIHYNQQFMKINPFWPAASASAPPMFGAKPCNLNVLPATELHANIPQSVHDKGPPAGMFSSHTTGKDAKSSQPATVTDPAQRKQQVLLQQAMPPVAPNNILHGPAFIFPFNQQQAVAASASVRPGSSKVTTTATGGSGAASSATVSSSTTAAAPALSFNYPSMSANETQYLAILQNNPYTYPIPAAGAPPNYRPGPHAQAMPLFNGSFYSSQMIHPSQVPQPQAPPVTQQTHQNSSGSTSSSQKHLQGQQRQQASAAAVHNTYHATHKSRSQPPAQQQNQHMNPSTGGEDSPSTADSRGSRAGNTMGGYNHNFSMPVSSKGLGQMDHPNGALTKAAFANNAASANSNDKKQQNQLQQQGLKRGGVESSLPPQTFAMSFAPMNGATSMAQNHAIFQSLPESLRPSFHMMSAPTSSTAAPHSQQKDFRITEEASRTTVTGHDSSNADDDRKASAGLTAKSGQSIAFSRPDVATDGSSSSNNRSSRSPITSSIATAAQSKHSLNAQYHQQAQQQALQLAKQHQQQQALQLQKGQQLSQAMNAYAMNARSKNPPSSNGGAYPEHTITSSSSMVAKFPNSISSFPLQTSNTSSSQVQSPQWRNSVRGPTTSQLPSSLASATSSSVKNLHQSQQSSRSHPQSHTQISFGSSTSQKLQPTTASVQMQQQQQNQNPGTNNSNRCSSPPMLVGSPTTSLSKGGGSGGGGGGSPRTTAAASTSGRTGQASSLSSSQQAKNSPVGTQRSSSPSILGNPNSSNSTKSQQQLQKQTLQQQQQQQQKVQAMMMYNHPYMQAQAQAQVQAQQQHALYRMQQQQQQSSSSSTATLSLCPPVTHASAATSDPAKAIAAATSMMNHPQYGGGPLPSMPAGFPQYVHNAPVAAATAAVQVKPAEQKQPAGE